MSKMIAVAATIAAVTMMSGLVTVNVEHHLNLPSEFTNRDLISEHSSGLWAKTYDIRVDAEFKGENSVRPIVRILQEATSRDTIRFHIAGVGGEVDTVLEIIDNVKATKAHTVMIVEAPSYSGHAYLAAAGNELIMMPYTFLMYHTSSGYGEDCQKQTGEDRTVSNVEHCLAFQTAHLSNVTKYLESISFMTKEEKNAVESGHDVYISADEYNSRKAGNTPDPQTISSNLTIVKVVNAVQAAVVNTPPKETKPSKDKKTK